MSSFLGGGGGGSSGGGRTVLTGNTTYYVRTTGSDSNPGTLAQPWATLQHASDFLGKTLDFAGFSVTVDIGAGSFQGVGVRNVVGGGNLMFAGAGSANTTITNGNNDSIVNGGECISFYFGMNTVCYLKRATLAANNPPVGAAVSCFEVVAFFTRDISNPNDTDVVVDCTNIGAGSVVWWVDFPGAQFGDNGITYIGGGATIFSIFFIQDGATFGIGPNVSSVTGALTISGPTAGFAYCDSNGKIVPISTAITGAGVVGKRYFTQIGGNIGNFVNGPGSLGPNFFPGTVGGSVDSSSSYDGFQGPLPGINTQTASYTLAVTDTLNRVEMNVAGANTVTVPANATVAFQMGARIWITQIGAGATTIAGAVGVTVDNAGAVGGQWKSILLYKRGTDEWVQTNV